jgi:hypothetical protein
MTVDEWRAWLRTDEARAIIKDPPQPAVIPPMPAGFSREFCRFVIAYAHELKENG